MRKSSSVEDGTDTGVTPQEKLPSAAVDWTMRLEPESESASASAREAATAGMAPSLR